jgi:hypothetical protein
MDSPEGNTHTGGVMAGGNMLDFVPLHLTAMDWSASLLAWVQSWIPDSAIEPLSPGDWYEAGHGIKG